MSFTNYFLLIVHPAEKGIEIEELDYKMDRLERMLSVSIIDKNN
jgi:hypothetical protein